MGQDPHAGTATMIRSHGHPTVAPLHDDEVAVSAVIGTIMILAITVIGIAGVLYYGAPTIDRIQSRNAQVAMEGSFETLRASVQELSVPDHARYPSINLPSGILGLEPGDRFLITADHDSAFSSCDLHVTDWSDAGADKARVSIATSGCRALVTVCTFPLAAGIGCLEVDAVSGNTITRQSVSFSGGVATVSGADFSKGDWAFRVTNAGTPVTIYAEAWLHSTDEITWALASATGSWSEFFDGGAVFSERDGSYFLEKAAPIGDATFGVGYYGLWLRTLVATGGVYQTITDTRSHAVSFSLLGVGTRVDDAGTYLLRFDVHGPLAEPWCNGFLARNLQLGGNGAYAQDADFPCELGDAEGLRSVTYSCLTCTGSGHPFKFRFLHSRIATSLAT